MLGLVGGLPSEACATTFTVGIQCTNNSLTGSSPVTLSGSCSNDVTSINNTASSSQGHLGAQMDVTESAGGAVSASAIFSTQVMFTATSGSALTSIPVALNLNTNGSLFASNGSTFWRLRSPGAGPIFNFDISRTIGSSPTFSAFGVAFSSGGESVTSSSDVISGTLTTDVVDVPLNAPINLTLQLIVGGVGVFTDNFLNSVDFPIGADVFTLPEGFTANDPDMNLIDNRFTPTATPLPATLPLLATGLGAVCLLGWRRKKKAAALAG